MAKRGGQPFITVKKADGTTERIALSEFQKRFSAAKTDKQKQNTSKPKRKKAKEPKKKPVVTKTQPVVKKPEEKKVSGPKNEQQKPQAAQVKVMELKPSKTLPLRGSKRGQVKPNRAPADTPADQTNTQVKVKELKPAKTLPLRGVRGSQINKKEPEKSKEDKSLVEVGEQDLSTSTPVKEVFVDEAKAKVEEEIKTLDKSQVVETEEDHRSLLEEEAPEHDKATKVIKRVKKPATGPVVSGLDFEIPEELKGRLDALVESRRKDVRTDDQFLDYAEKPVESGGLGLEPDQALTLLKSVRDVYSIDTNDIPKPRPIWGSGQMKRMHAPGLQTVSETVAKEDEGDQMQVGSGLPKKEMQDVVPPSPQEQTIEGPVGPVDEIANLKLVDWRRLGESADAKERVLQKFEALAEESYLLYLKAKDVWRHSPLHERYLKAITEAIKSGEGLGVSLQSNELTTEDFDAIVGINAGLNN